MLQSIQQIQGLYLQVAENVALRDLVTEDSEAVYKIRSDKEVMKYIDDDLLQNTAEATNWIKKQRLKPDAWRWAMVKDNSLMGTIGISHINFKHHFAFIGFEIAREWQEKGMGYLAVSFLSTYLLKTPLLHRIEAQCHTNNIASIKTLEKCGYQKEAFQKGNFLMEGKYQDSFLYSMVAS